MGISMNKSLSSYTYYASRMSLVCLIPSIMYWFTSGFWVGLKIFGSFMLVCQLTGVWIYRKDLITAFRKNN